MALFWLTIGLAATVYIVAIYGLTRCREVGFRIDTSSRHIAHNRRMIRENAARLASIAERTPPQGEAPSHPASGSWSLGRDGVLLTPMTIRHGPVAQWQYPA